MEKIRRSNLESHPDYNTVIDEVINHNVDKSVMAEAIKRAKNKSQAEAIYVVMRLQNH